MAIVAWSAPSPPTTSSIFDTSVLKLARLRVYYGVTSLINAVVLILLRILVGSHGSLAEQKLRALSGLKTMLQWLYYLCMAAAFTYKGYLLTSKDLNNWPQLFFFANKSFIKHTHFRKERKRIQILVLIRQALTE